MVLALLAVAFLTAAPFVALACGATAQSAAKRDQITQQASLHQVPALALKDASSARAEIIPGRRHSPRPG